SPAPPLPPVPRRSVRAPPLALAAPPISSFPFGAPPRHAPSANTTNIPAHVPTNLRAFPITTSPSATSLQGKRRAPARQSTPVTPLAKEGKRAGRLTPEDAMGSSARRLGGLGGLEGKVAIVTGASAGIGRACALALAREG